MKRLAQLCLAAAPLSILAAAGPEYSHPVRVGLVTDSRLPEVSGMLPVTGSKRCYWVHNDSGASARIYAILESGTIVAVVSVKGAAATDWEDIAKGPAPGKVAAAGEKNARGCLYIADTGNNDRSRKELVVWRIQEPVLPEIPAKETPRKEASLETEPAVAIRFRYPGKPLDCEAMVVHPETRKIYLLTKELFQSHVFRIDGGVEGTGPAQVAEEVATMSPGFLTTAADLSSDSRRLALRTYVEVQEYVLPEGAGFEQIFEQPKRVLPSSLLEVQGEAICYDHDGVSLLTISEAKPKVIHRISPRQAGAAKP